jgi:hypothetical protein
MEEIWKDIKGYEGLYQVSTFGRVKALSRTIVDSMGRHMCREERILCPRISSQTGYPAVNLSKDSEARTHNIHRLVAEAFIPNPSDLPCINHKDESRDNNHVENLEWCTYLYNNTYGTAPERRNKSIREFFDTHTVEGHLLPSVPIVQYTLKGEAVREFRSINEAERELHLGQSSGVSACCNGKLKTAYGFVWRFKEEPFSLEEYKPKRHQKFVIKRDKDGNEVARYKSVSEAARENGFERHALRKTNLIDGFCYEVEKKENEFIPTGHKGPRPDLVGKCAKKIYQYTKDGKFVAEYNSIKAAAIAMGGEKRSSDIINCARGNIRSAFGFDWRYNKK